MVDVGGLAGPGCPGDPFKRCGAKPPTFWKGLPGPWGRPDPKNLSFPVRSHFGSSNFGSSQNLAPLLRSRRLRGYVIRRHQLHRLVADLLRTVLRGMACACAGCSLCQLRPHFERLFSEVLLHGFINMNHLALFTTPLSSSHRPAYLPTLTALSYLFV